MTSAISRFLSVLLSFHLMSVINSRRLWIYLIEAMVDHAKQSRAAGQVALYRLWCSYRLPCATMVTRAVLVHLFIGGTEKSGLPLVTMTAGSITDSGRL